MLMKENKSEVCICGLNGHVFIDETATLTPDEVEEERIRIEKETMEITIDNFREFSGTIILTNEEPSWFKLMGLLGGWYWKGKVPRMRGKRLWWVRNSS